MKNTIFTLRTTTIVFALCLSFLTISIDAQNRDYTAVYRLYNSQNQRHLFTRDCQEKSNLGQNSGYNYEGAAFYVSINQKRRTVPLHRILLSSGGHLYTTSEDERQKLSQDAENRYESVVGYVAESSQKNTVPLYRLFNNERHFYTTNEQEKNTFLQNGGRLEGITGYVWTSGANPCDYGNPTNPTNPNDPNAFPVIYAGTNYDGAAEAIERDKTELADWDGSPHTIRSIRVPDGWYFVLYTKKNFRGKSYNLNSNITFAPGDEWYNKIRSIKVYKGTPPKQPR